MSREVSVHVRPSAPPPPKKNTIPALILISTLGLLSLIAWLQFATPPVPAVATPPAMPSSSALGASAPAALPAAPSAPVSVPAAETRLDPQPLRASEPSVERAIAAPALPASSEPRKVPAHNSKVPAHSMPKNPVVLPPPKRQIDAGPIRNNSLSAATPAASASSAAASAASASSAPAAPGRSASIPARTDFSYSQPRASGASAPTAAGSGTPVSQPGVSGLDRNTLVVPNHFFQPKAVATTTDKAWVQLTPSTVRVVRTGEAFETYGPLKKITDSALEFEHGVIPVQKP